MFTLEINELLNGNAGPVFSTGLKSKIVGATSVLLRKDQSLYTEDDYIIISQLLHLGNIIYHNMDLSEEELPLDSEIYDMLLVRYQQSGRVAQVGAEPIIFPNISKVRREGTISSKDLFRTFDTSGYLYRDSMILPSSVDSDNKFLFRLSGYQSEKKYRVVSHGNNNLVGTLDKAKFVLNIQAKDKDCFDDPSTTIFERDFFAPHKMANILPCDIKSVMELKYDGISVVCKIHNGTVVSAYSRGDTTADQALDYTSILYGYTFPNLPDGIDLEVKFEAVVSYTDLQLLSNLMNKSYANPRSAIVGIFGSNNGYLYQDYITLVPLAMDIAIDNDMSREEEILFLNKYIATKEPLRYQVIEGDYTKTLYMVKKFTEEAEALKDVMPILYDGVVFSYNDTTIRNSLGRKDFVNKFSIAIKFNAMKKLTRLTNITFTVGQNGVITPMAWYEPVVFLGGIHEKSSLASIDRLNRNQFKIGNIVELEYRNDVMPYCTNLPDLDENIDNPYPIITMPTCCPVCHGEIILSDSGKSAKCVNISCPGRNISRLDSMMKKMKLKDIAEESISKINKSSLSELLNTTVEEAKFCLGEANGLKLMRNIEDIKTTKRFDYEIVGALGFTDVAQGTWEKILRVYTLGELVKMYFDMGTTLYDALVNIKGIGSKVANTIYKEMEFFMDDIVYCILDLPIVQTKGSGKRVQVRCTGFRDRDLMDKLCSLGYDADDNASVTKDTAILLVPNIGHSSSKMKKVGENTAIIAIDDFMSNIDMYLSKYPSNIHL